LIVNAEAIKQVAVDAILDTHPDMFEDDLVVDEQRHVTLICQPEPDFQDAASVDYHVRGCHALFRFMKRDSISLQRFADDQGSCYELRTAIGYSVTVFTDGTAQVREVTDQAVTTAWIDCLRLLDSAGTDTKDGIRPSAPLEIAPGIANVPQGRGLFYVDVVGIREAAESAVQEAYPDYSEGGLLPDPANHPLPVHCRSLVDQLGESPIAGTVQCSAHVMFRIADSVESALFLDEGGACYIAGKHLGVEVIVGEDGTTEVAQPRLICLSSTGDGIECDPDSNALLGRDAYEAWCSPSERQAQ